MTVAIPIGPRVIVVGTHAGRFYILKRISAAPERYIGYVREGESGVDRFIFRHGKDIATAMRLVADHIEGLAGIEAAIANMQSSQGAVA